MEENAKKKKLNIPRLVMLATGVLLALLVGIFALVLEAGKKSLTDQTLVNRWSDGKEFAQISLFISPSQYVTNDEIGLYRHEIESGYKTKGMVAAFEPETGNPNLMDAYMATTTMDLKGEYGSKTLDTFCVGGDFFLFHPVRLLSGNYFSEDDLMHDYILLDEEAAWDLFGGTDVAGKKVEWNDMELVVAGIYRRESGEIETLAAGNSEPKVFVSYDLFKYDPAKPAITSYELLAPNPIKNYATDVVNSITVFPDDAVKTVENSSRFSYANYYELLKNRKGRIMRTDDIPFPYWENLARYKEGKLMYVALWQWILATVLFVLVFVNLMVFLVQHKPTKETFEKLMDKIREKRRAKKEGVIVFDEE